MQFEALIYEKSGGVAQVTLNRPERMNALNRALQREVTDAFGFADQDAEVRCVLISGNGRGFCSGADLGGGSRDVEEAWPDVGPVGGLGRMVMAVRNCRKPTIAAVNGAAVGAGLSIALACDLRIVSELARFAAIFVRRGIMPDSGSTFLLPQIVRLDNALKLMMTGAIIDAKEADRVGLCTELVAHEDLLPRARALAEEIAKGASLAIGFARNAVYAGMYTTLADALLTEQHYVGICNLSEDQAEGVRAFLEKREPAFQGR